MYEIPESMNSKNKNDVSKLYRKKAGDSFKARFDLLLYHRITNDVTSPISYDELDQFLIEENEDCLKEYINVYWQHEDINEGIFDGKSIDDIYNAMEQWKTQNESNIAELRDHYINNTFNGVFPLNAFKEFFNGDSDAN